MDNIFIKILGYAVIPVLSMTIGGIIAAYFQPKRKIRSILLHFAAGIVFAVVAVDILPDILKNASIPQVGFGFTVGVFVMLGIKQIMKNAEVRSKEMSGLVPVKKSPLGISVGIGVDIFVDGILIGVGFAAGQNEGLMLAVALSVEIFALGLTVSSELGQIGISNIRKILTVAGISLFIIFGAALGAVMLKFLDQNILEIVLSFGLAALLYLVTEELLVEAHEEPDSPLVSSTFFIGFIIFLILGMIH